MSEAAALTKSLTLDMTTHGIKRLYQIAELSTAAVDDILNELDEVEYLLPATLLVLSEAEMRFAELNEKLTEHAITAMSYQGLGGTHEGC